MTTFIHQSQLRSTPGILEVLLIPVLSFTPPPRSSFFFLFFSAKESGASIVNIPPGSQRERIALRAVSVRLPGAKCPVRKNARRSLDRECRGGWIRPASVGGRGVDLTQLGDIPIFPRSFFFLSFSVLPPCKKKNYLLEKTPVNACMYVCVCGV